MSDINADFLHVIASLTAEGLEPEEIRSRTDLDVSYIRRIQASADFPEALRAISEDAHALWEEAQTSKLARRRVKMAAREDAPEHYQMVRDTVRTSGTMSDAEKVRTLMQLIQFSGAVDDRVEEETIHLSPTQLALLQETLRESRDDQPDGFKN